jgi:5'(3')-deoxyribonucleotidase
VSKELIAVDVDEVLFPMLESFLEHHNPTYGTTHKFSDFLSYDFEHTLGVPIEETVRRVYEYLDMDNHLVEAVKGSQAAIARLSERYDLAVLTARHPRYEQPTINWIHNRFERVFNQIVCVGYAPIMEQPVTKADICKELGAKALIDDSLSHINHCAEAGIEGVLFGDYPWNQTDTLPDSVTRCRDWEEVTEHFDARS